MKLLNFDLKLSNPGTFKCYITEVESNLPILTSSHIGIYGSQYVRRIYRVVT